MICYYKIIGLVQGVCFRVSTQEQAAALGLQGWVRNSSDGAVEVLANGSPDQLQVLEQWLNKGPTYAKVAAVDMRKIAPTDPDYASYANLSAGFHITY